MLSADELKNAWLIFTDGACSGNPGPGGWAAITVHPQGQVKELGQHHEHVTNNHMELKAVLEALRYVSREKIPVVLYTDSTYVIRGATQWMWGWKKRGWKNAEGLSVANRDLWEEMMRVLANFSKDQISWRYCRGHRGTPGNERCDEIAVGFSHKRYVDLYNGDLLNYPIAIHDVPEQEALPEMKPKLEKPPAFSYLSQLNGEVQRHSSWAACEKRVKGKSGAKFKKAMNEAGESQILTDWGLKPDVKINSGD